MPSDDLRPIRSYSKQAYKPEPNLVLAFESAFALEGGRYVEKDDLAQWYLLRYWDYSSKLMSVPLYQRYLTRYHVDFVANPRMNAVARADDDTYLIGIYAGAMLNIEAFFSIVFSHPKVFPDIGVPQRESVWFHSLDLCDWRMPLEAIIRQMGVISEVPRDFPVDRQRSLYAHRMAILAMDFLFFHELGHLANGHVEYLAGSAGVAAVREVPDTELTDEDAFCRQALELNADTHALSFMLRDFLAAPEALPTTFAFPTVTEAIESMALALVSVFMMFDPFHAAPGHYHSATHPHPAVRLTNVWMSALQLIHQAPRQRAAGIEAAWLRGVERAEAVCQILGIGVSLWHAIGVMSTEVMSEYERVGRKFMEIDAHLRPDVPRRRPSAK